MMRRYNRRDEQQANNARQFAHNALQHYHPQPVYQASLPRAKVKDVLCSFCSRKFYLRRDLKGNNSPLLLPCGHPTCTNCELANSYRPCPICLYQSSDPRQNLPHNVYIIGLIHSLNSSPTYTDDSEISFCIPSKAVSRQNYYQGVCKECGMIASLKCNQCTVFYCKLCFKKMHQHALHDHEAVPLNVNAVDEMLSNSHCLICNHEARSCEYYCNNCDIECCSHCIIRSHSTHETILQVDRNTDFIGEFYAALKKLKETKVWTQETLKNFRQKLPYEEIVRKAKDVEKQITNHFIYIHGILQNLEGQLKDQVAQYLNNFEHDIEDCENMLANQKERLAYVTSVFERANLNGKPINVKKFTERMLELSKLPCHFLPIDEYQEELSFEIDDSILDLEQYVRLYIPSNPKLNLVSTDDLPENYNLAALPDDETMNLSLRQEDPEESPALTPRSQSPQDCGPVEPKELTMGSIDRVRMIHVDNPVDFYVQRLCELPYLKEIEDNIKEHIRNNDPPVPETIELRRPYIVERNGKWSRGRVMKKQESIEFGTTYDVFYIDYGYTETDVTENRIRNSMPQFSLLKPCALHCTFPEIAPMDEVWYDESITQFKNAVFGHELTMQTLNITENLYTVKLSKMKDDGTMSISIYDWLIDVKLAKSTTFNKLLRMNPESAKHFYTEELPLEKYSRVRVSYVESPECIYVIKKETDYKNYKKDTFNREYSEYLRSKSVTKRSCELGNAVCISFSKYKWQRGIVQTIDSEKKTMKVFLVDLGIVCEADFNKVHPLPARFCETHAQAIKISLIHVKPVEGDKWPIEVINYLKSNIENRKVKVFPFSQNHEKVYNVMIELGDTNVNANLVSMHHAISTGVHSKHASLNKSLTLPKKPRKKSSSKSKSITEAVKTKDEYIILPEVPKKKKHKGTEDIDPYKVRVDINKIISPDAIFVSQHSSASDFEDLKQNMKTFYESHEGQWDHDLQPEIYYCFYSPKDKAYCRAQFLCMSDEDSKIAKMYLIDMAEIEDVPVESIQPLNDRFLEVPKHIFKVKLAGIRPTGGTSTWQSTSCQRLNDIINDTGDSKYYITMVGSTDDGMVLLVDLIIRRNVITGPIEPQKKETISVSLRMVEEGVALPIKGYLNDTKELAGELRRKLQLDNGSGENSTSAPENLKTSPTESLNPDDNASTETPSERATSNDDALANGDQLNNVSSESVPLPPKVCDWLPAAHLRDNEFDAVVTNVDNDGDIYFYPNTKEYNLMLKYISDTLNSHFKDKTIKNYDYTWEKGDLCIVNYHADKKWYRGKVVEVINSQTVKVFFVDYGNTEDCSIGTVKKRIILGDIPVQSTKATIAGLKPVNLNWETNDLDIIHVLIVSQPCKIRIVQKPPHPWKVALWVTKDSKTYSVPWFLKNQTEVQCTIEDQELYLEAEDRAPYQESGIPISISNGLDTKSKHNESSSDDEKSDVESADEEDSDLDNSKIDCSTTLRDEDYPNDLTAKMDHLVLSDSINESFNCLKDKDRSRSSSACSFLNGRKYSLSFEKPKANSSDCSESDSVIEPFDLCNHANEEMISGNSVLFSTNCDPDDFDSLSVKTDMICNGEDKEDLISSTPLNTSLTLLQDDNNFKQIDFQKYNVKHFEMGLGQAFSEIHMSGYLINSNNRELNKWITKAHKLIEQIQEHVEEQDLFLPNTGEFCIAQYDDGLWYRARTIKKVVDNGKCSITVEFIDYGNRMMIDDVNCIRTIRKDWLDVPGMSFYFKLFNVKVATGRNKEVLGEIGRVLGQSNRYFVHIKRYDPELELEIYTSKGNKRLVYASLIEENLLEKINPKER